jgi:pimeloyl-ACP methyl ester carboxylesterase
VTIFGFVHGAWHGAWCWDLVAEQLSDRGHESIAIDLPTEDPLAGADAYADAVVAALKDYDDIVLVGHSLGGLTVPVVAARRPVRRMVLVAPLLPTPGSSFDEQYAAEPEILMPGLGAGQTELPDGSSQWQPQAAIATMYPDAPPPVAEWAAGRLRRQHWRVSREVTPLPAWPDAEVRVIACAQDSVVNPDWVRRSAKVRFGAEAHVIGGDHSPFLARPRELVDVLLD